MDDTFLQPFQTLSQADKTPQINKRPCPFIKYAKDNLSVKYIGRGLRYSDVASVQANRPASQDSIIYYYEVQINQMSSGGNIIIGFGEGNFPVTKQPGWTKSSYGYKGDGKLYHAKQKENNTLQKFTVGCVVGCGMNFFKKEIFYTVNGIHCGRITCKGVAFKNVLPREYYPTISLRGLHENITFNFGDQPFRYNIKQKISKEQEECSATILKQPLSEYTIHQIIHAYLNFNGYAKTLEAFEEATRIKDKDVELLKKTILSEDEEEEKTEARKESNEYHNFAHNNKHTFKDTYMEVEAKKAKDEFELCEELFLEEQRRRSYSDVFEVELFSRDFSKTYSIEIEDAGTSPKSDSNARDPTFRKDSDFIDGHSVDPQQDNPIIVLGETNTVKPTKRDGSMSKNTFLHERAEIRKSILEGKIEEAILIIQKIFPKLFTESSEVSKALYIQRFLEYLKAKDHFPAIKYAQTYLVPFQNEQAICIDKERLPSIMPIDNLMGLLCYPDPEKTDLGYLLSQDQRELTADTVNKGILDKLGFLNKSTLEVLLAQFSLVQQGITERGLYNPSNLVNNVK